ncbi:MAG TPA: hypothetical protein PKH08_03775 [Clostridia bacterium]|jgi:hypothetical protein|nr:hypothetical protein [Clostridia bacterium]HOL61722.1 hypothetical protein [Clostridia bacterium]HPO54349.1 hypothetical protein [Clostridia bacterium]
MAISSANQKGKQVYVYDEKGARVGTHSGTLQGCTGGTVTVQKGDHIYTYNDKGQIISVRNVK